MVRKERWLVHSSVLQHMIIRSLALSAPPESPQGHHAWAQRKGVAGTMRRISITSLDRLHNLGARDLPITAITMVIFANQVRVPWRS